MLGLLMLDAEVCCRMQDTHAVLLELVVGVDLWAPVDEWTNSLKIVGIHREDILLMLEQPSLHAASMILVSGTEVHRPEC
jgi:hypothetical protein